jgi:hypothetical protein
LLYSQDYFSPPNWHVGVKPDLRGKSQSQVKSSQSHDFDFFEKKQKSQSHDFDVFVKTEKSQSHDFNFFVKTEKSQSLDFDLTF